MRKKRKRCSKCGKPGKFAADLRARDRLQSQCLKCQRSADNARYARDPRKREARKLRQRVYWKSLTVEQQRKHSRKGYLKYFYGISPEQFAALLQAQGGVCAICSLPPKGKRTSTLQVDHDHETGHLRGLLCNECNTALGRLGDDVAGLERAIRYLQEATAKVAHALARDVCLYPLKIPDPRKRLAGI